MFPSCPTAIVVRDQFHGWRLRSGLRKKISYPAVRPLLAAPSALGPRDQEPCEQVLRDALARKQFLLHYQPIVHALERQVIEYEALIRWCTDERGLVPPVEFIPVAERTNFITELTAWILQEACREMTFQSDVLGISVNISPVSFLNGDLVSIVASALETTGLQPNRLTIEITESVHLNRTDSVSEQLETLARMGVHVAIDDFGTGYSSLAALSTFSFNRLKLDRSFVSNIESDVKARTVVRAILTIAKDLDLQTVAEGIETENEARIMTDMGVHALQGYYFGRPMPASVAFLTLPRCP